MNQANCPPLVYRIPLAFTKSQFESLTNYLTAEEQARSTRYLVDQPRHQFVGCRVALKFLLADKLRCAPSDVRFGTQRWGKPVLQSPLGTLSIGSSSVGETIQFSVSHSGDCGLVGLAGQPIGVDIEALKPRIQVASLASIVLSSQEQAVWKNLPPRDYEQQMLRLWVCKEALLKALGLGIAECLQQVSFPIPVPPTEAFSPNWIDPSIQIHLEEEPNCSRNSWTLSESWTVRLLQSSEHHVSAIALLNHQASVEIRDFDWSIVT